jgi:hypothetical protein
MGLRVRGYDEVLPSVLRMTPEYQKRVWGENVQFVDILLLQHFNYPTPGQIMRVTREMMQRRQRGEKINGFTRAEDLVLKLDSANFESVENTLTQEDMDVKKVIGDKPYGQRHLVITHGLLSKKEHDSLNVKDKKGICLYNANSYANLIGREFSTLYSADLHIKNAKTVAETIAPFKEQRKKVFAKGKVYSLELSGVIDALTSYKVRSERFFKSIDHTPQLLDDCVYKLLESARQDCDTELIANQQVIHDRIM